MPLPEQTYIPGPVCHYGHIRTVRNTGWVKYKVRGKTYLYARCKSCMSDRQKVYYRRRAEREKKLLEAAE